MRSSLGSGSSPVYRCAWRPGGATKARSSWTTAQTRMTISPCRCRNWSQLQGNAMTGTIRASRPLPPSSSLPVGRSPLEVLRNYRDVIKTGGGSIAFECRNETCGGDINEGNSQAAGFVRVSPPVAAQAPAPAPSRQSPRARSRRVRPRSTLENWSRAVSETREAAGVITIGRPRRRLASTAW